METRYTPQIVTSPQFRLKVVQRMGVTSVIVLCILCFIGCSQNEINELRKEINGLRLENVRYKFLVDSLRNEIAKIKDSDKYHYQTGVELSKSERFEDAKYEFQSVVDKYPMSSLATLAKQQIKDIKEKQLAEERRKLAEEKRKLAEEKRRKEEEKYKPRSASAAIEEWKNFRSNETKFKGTTTTWRFPVSYFLSDENPHGFLDQAAGGYGSEYAVVVQGPEGFTYQAAAVFGKVPVVKEKDWIVVTGRFLRVSSDNVVVLSPLRLINEGYK